MKVPQRSVIKSHLSSLAPSLSFSFPPSLPPSFPPMFLFYFFFLQTGYFCSLPVLTIIQHGINVPSLYPFLPLRSSAMLLHVAVLSFEAPVMEEGQMSFLHPHSTLVRFLSPILPQQDDLGSLSVKT